VPLLTCDDALPRRPGRVLVAGTSGAGKTTLARRLGALLELPCVELDALFHGPGWAPRQDFPGDVRRVAAAPAWVTEWQYTGARPLLAERAELLVWLDLPRAVVMRRLVLRTVVRRLRRQELWNGNQEPPLRTFLTDPGHVVRWAWRNHAPGRARVLALRHEQPELVVVRLRTAEEVERWLGGPLRDVAGRSAR
jgi:adenylate kinase family enzyme